MFCSSRTVTLRSQNPHFDDVDESKYADANHVIFRPVQAKECAVRKACEQRVESVLSSECRKVANAFHHLVESASRDATAKRVHECVRERRGRGGGQRVRGILRRRVWCFRWQREHSRVRHVICRSGAAAFLVVETVHDSFGV